MQIVSGKCEDSAGSKYAACFAERLDPVVMRERVNHIRGCEDKIEGAIFKHLQVPKVGLANTNLRHFSLKIIHHHWRIIDSFITPREWSEKSRGASCAYADI